MPLRREGEWRYHTIHDLSTSWKWASCLCCFPTGQTAVGTNWLRVLVNPRAVWAVWKGEKSCISALHIALLTFYWEVLSYNFVNSSYLDWGFLWFPLGPSGNSQNSTDIGMICTFQFCSWILYDLWYRKYKISHQRKKTTWDAADWSYNHGLILLSSLRWSLETATRMSAWSWNCWTDHMSALACKL
jgi:hypothetical protein